MLKTGILSEIKEWPSKYTWPNGQPKPSNWTFKIDDGERYGIKGKPPAGLKAGDNVQFDANKNAKGYWEVDPVTIVPASPATIATAPAQIATKAPTTGYKSDAVQNAISYQAARKDALETVKMLLDKDLIDFGKAKGAQKIELVEIFIDNYTVRYAEDTARLAPKPHGNPLEAEYGEDVTAAKKPRGRPAAKKAPEPEDGLIPKEDDDDLPW